MSDYMFMLESHLSPEQNQVVAAVEAAAGQTGVNAFLTGGAMRDMLGGFPIRDLDFVVEGNPQKLVRAVTEKTGARIVEVDENAKAWELVFAGGVTSSISMAHQARYARIGAKPRIQPATIHEDLRGRDFTINAIALSLNRASRGLLLDPTNGLADIEYREIRATGNYVLYDDPTRLLRLIRLRARLGFGITEKTQSQYQNARDSQMETRIPTEVLLKELRATADEPNPGEVLEALRQENLIHLYSPALAGPKLNLAGYARLMRAKQHVPYGIDLRLNNLGLFFWLLTENLSAKEKADLISRLPMDRRARDLWEKLPARAKKLESALKSAKLKKPADVYHVLRPAPGDEILFLLIRSPLRIVQDRIKHYLQKYLPASLEVTDQDVAAKGVKPGTPKFDKARAELIAAHLNARPKRPAPLEEAEPEAQPSAAGGRK